MATKYFTYKGEKVLDPFAGSCTTQKVAAENGRIGIGIELNKKDFRTPILKRLKSQGDLLKEELSIEEFNFLKLKKNNKQI